MADNNGNGGGSATTVLVSVIIILIIGVAFYFGFVRGNWGGNNSDSGVDIHLNAPATGGTSGNGY